MGDLISRQEALKSPVKMVSEGLEWIPAFHIKYLPPAQPERKMQCNFCNMSICTLGDRPCSRKVEKNETDRCGCSR